MRRRSTVKNRFFRFGWLLCLYAICFSLLTSCDRLSLFKEDTGVKQTTESEEIVDPNQQIQRIIELIEADDPNKLMEWIHPQAIERYGKQQIVERNDLIHRELDVQTIALKNMQPLQQDGREGQITYQGEAIYTTGFGEIRKQTTLTFIYYPKEKRWQLDWTPGVILPGLHDTGTVRIMPLKARRGNIFDRAGNPLANTGMINRLSVVPGSLNRANIPTIEALYELEPGSIERALEQTWVQDNTLVPLKVMRELNEEQRKRAIELNVSLDLIETRTYPLAEAAAHLIGYVGYPTAEDLELPEYANVKAHDFIGKSGLEKIYDSVLRGKHGFKVMITGEFEQVLLEEPVVDGKDIYLTLDSKTQKTIYETLQNENMTVTALDPRNGDILALVSVPSYNPHTFVLGISQAEYQQLLEDPRTPLFAKFSGALTPGSTEKLITAIGAMNAGHLTPDKAYEINGKGWTLDASWGNYQVIRYLEFNGTVDLEKALVLSDNIYFARVATEMGIETFNEQMKKLLFGETLTADYPFVVSQLTNNGPVSDTILLADAAYGQGQLLISPVHLASLYGAIANQGAWLRPRLNLATEQQVLSQAIVSQTNLKALDHALRQVVVETYPQQLNLEGYGLAGKSGTAEAGLDEQGNVRQMSSFVAYDQNLRNLVVSVTCFDTQNEDVGFATVRTARVFQALYQDGPYQPATPKTH